MKSLNYKCQGRSLFNFWLSICIIHKFTEECAVSLLFFWVMPCLLFALSSHNMCLPLGIHLALRELSFKILAFKSFLIGKNLPRLLHNIQKWLCSAKPWVLMLRNWNELAVIFLRINTCDQKNPRDQNSVLVPLLKKFQGKRSAAGTDFCLKPERECWNS